MMYTVITRFSANVRFGSRPSYGSESFRKPGGYDSGVSAEYGYANNGHGGYGFSRPTGYGGSVSSGGHGISGTFANGEEFGPVEPTHPEGHAPPPPNIQAQKVTFFLHRSIHRQFFRRISSNALSIFIILNRP